jgi:hypothetical protein
MPDIFPIDHLATCAKFQGSLACLPNFRTEHIGLF